MANTASAKKQRMPEAKVTMVDIGKINAADREWAADLEYGSDCDSGKSLYMHTPRIDR